METHFTQGLDPEPRARAVFVFHRPETLADLLKGLAANGSRAGWQSDSYLCSHLIDPALLRADSFDAFMADRQRQLLGLIEQGTGKAAYVGEVAEEGDDVESDEDSAEAVMTIAT